MKFYYPENLEAKPMFCVWTRGNTFIILFGILGAFFLFAVFHTVIPLLSVAIYTVLTATLGDVSIYGYVLRMWRFVISQQMIFFWRQPVEVIKK